MKTTVTDELLNIHVSLDGDNTWTGRSAFAGPCGAGPFATLHRAQQAVPKQGNPLPKIARVLKRAVPPDPTVSPAAK